MSHEHEYRETIRWRDGKVWQVLVCACGHESWGFLTENTATIKARRSK